MKSKYILILIFILIISGCSDESSRNELLLSKYETAYGELVENDTFTTNSDLFDLEVVVNKINEHEYRIDVILDKPQMAMYNVQMMMEINPSGVAQYDEVLPSLGIVDDTQYNLIPYQSNIENGFYSGLVLSGISTKSSGEITLMIQWTDYAATKVFDEFIKLEYSEKDIVELEDDGNE